jgi:diguanylate cyclase (GGDEF)-like protein
MGEEFLEGELKDLVLATDRLSILIIDVDGQGGINTRFGFEVGDLVLQAVAQIVASDPQCSRVGRCGDDTFFALVHSGVEVADQVAQRIVDEVREYYWPQITPGLWVRCSIGVAEFGDSTDAVIRAAIGCREVRRKHGGNGVARGPLLMPDGKFREETRSMRLKDIHS